MAADVELLGNLGLGVLAGAQQRTPFLEIRLSECFGPAAYMAAPPCRGETGMNPLPQDVALELR